LKINKKEVYWRINLKLMPIVFKGSLTRDFFFVVEIKGV